MRLLENSTLGDNVQAPLAPPSTIAPNRSVGVSANCNAKIRESLKKGCYEDKGTGLNIYRLSTGNLSNVLLYSIFHIGRNFGLTSKFDKL